MIRESLVGGHVGLVKELHIIEPQLGDPRIWVATAETASTGPIWGHDLVGSCGGAGLTEEAAVASALGEAAERYAAAGQCLGQVFLGRPEEMASEPATWRSLVPPAWPKEPAGARWAWTKAQDGVPIPAALVYVPYSPLKEEWVPFPCVSTGLAAAPTFKEAVEKGFFEIVERDAVARFWYGRGAGAREIPIKTVKSDILDVFAGCRAKIKLLSLDAYNEIPTAFCLMESLYGCSPLISVGSASAATWEIASRKALIEAAHDQSYVRYLVRKGKSSWPPEDFEAHAAWASLRPADWLKASEFIRAVQPGEWPGPKPMASCQQLLRFVVDLTPRDLRSLGMYVARTVIPDLLPLPGHDLMRSTKHPRFPREENPWPHPMP